MRRFLGAVLALFIAILGLAWIAPAAEAHTGDLDAMYVCQPDGTYLVTYILTLSQVPAGNTGAVSWRIGTNNFESTPTNANGMTSWGNKAGNGTITLGTKTLPGNSTQAPWAYAYTMWTPDNFGKGSDGGDISLDGKCKAPDVKDASASVSTTPPDCDNAEKLVLGVVTNATWGTPTKTVGPGAYSVKATTTAGHLFSDGTTSKTFTGTLAGKKSATECRTPVTPAFPEPTPPTCQSPGGFDFSGTPTQNPNGVERDGYHLYVSPAPGSGPGEYTFTAYAIGTAGGFGYPHGTIFPDGKTTVTKTITVLPQLTGPSVDCPVTLPPPPAPQWVDECGPGNGHYVYTDGEHFHYVVTTNENGSTTITAVPDEGYNFGEATTSWTARDSGALCPAVPVAPSVSQDHCTGPGQSGGFGITLPPNGGGITYSVSGLVVTASTSEGYGFDAETLPAGWTYVDAHHATYKVTRYSPGNCTVTATPVAPSVTQAVCTGPGTASDPVITPGVTAGITYTVSGALVTATPASGYTLTAPAGWVLHSDGTATYSVSLTDPGDCLVGVEVAAPTLVDQTCTKDGDIVLPSVDHVTWKIEKGDTTVSARSTVPGAGIYTVTAVPDAGYTIVGQSVWVLDVPAATPKDCVVPPKHVRGHVTFAQQCGVKHDTFKAKDVKGVYYTVNGKRIREGVRLSARGHVVVKVHADSAKFKVVGKRVWKHQFSGKACHQPPHNPPHTGLRLGMVPGKL